ncbi:MAG: MFS transporter [Candidatus Omnitrophica bacterium]|nr:MFS transporter [Candidatus Omnitrophota bacterium]
MSKFRVLLREKNFFCFWLGQIVSQFGDRLNQMALIALVYNRTGGSAFGLAKVMSFTIIPSFLIGPFAGAYVDRWNYKYTMITTDLVRAALVLLIPLFITKGHSIVFLYIVVFLVFSTSCFFLPSKFSIIPELVTKEKLLLANSLANTTMMIAAVVGIGLGGPLIEKVGAHCGFYIDAGTYLFSAILLSFLKFEIDSSKRKDDMRKSLRLINKSIFSDIREGIRYVFSRPYVRFVFLTIFILMSGAGALYIVGIVFIQQIFNSITRDLGLLSVFLGAGLFLGAVLYGRLGQKISKVKIIFCNLIFLGFLLAGFGLALRFYPSQFVAAGIAVCIGVAVGPVFISGNTLIHEVIKSEMRGRIFSLLGIVMNLGFLMAMFIASKLSEFFPPLYVILLISALFVIYGIAGWFSFRGKL